MKAMIFAAGLGTRLQHLTESQPKALVEINGVPLLKSVIERLNEFGYSEFIINVHHFATQIIDYLKRNNNFGNRIEISDESEMLLDTGGGLNKASWFFDDGKPFLVYNVDVLSDINLTTLYDNHVKSGSLVTLAVKMRTTSRYLLFNSQYRLCGWENRKTGERKLPVKTQKNLLPLAFSGIHMIDPAIFNLYNRTGKFSMIDLYLKLAGKHLINGFNHDKDFWIDLGKPEAIMNAELYMQNVKK